jgi:alkylation response protein AidB-like acyl-CoA dehydrogenase
MDLVITEEQQLLRDSAREFVTASQPLRRIRMLRDSKNPTGFSLDLWAEMAKLGWTGILFPEKYGGAALGYSEVAVVMEELGRGLGQCHSARRLGRAASESASAADRRQAADDARLPRAARPLRPVQH